jgi:MoxR-like ATPase
MMRMIVEVHFPKLDEELMSVCISTFYRLRELRGIEKKPATRELINWIRALKSDPDFRPKTLLQGRAPFLGILFKKSADLQQAIQQVVKSRG